MPKYLFGRKTLKRVVKGGGSGGREAVTKKFEGLGGTLDSIFFASGDIDVCVVADLLDNETVAAASLAVNQSGVVTAKVVVLMAPEEVDKAAKTSIDDRPAGR